MTIFTVFFFSLFWLQILNLPASLQNKNTRVGPFAWKRSVLQNPDRERTNQSTGICLRLGLPYNKPRYDPDMTAMGQCLAGTHTHSTVQGMMLRNIQKFNSFKQTNNNQSVTLP